MPRSPPLDASQGHDCTSASSLAWRSSPTAAPTGEQACPDHDDLALGQAGVYALSGEFRRMLDAITLKFSVERTLCGQNNIRPSALGGLTTWKMR